MAEREDIELFLQGEGIREIVLIQVPRGGQVQDIFAAARASGLVVVEGAALFLEDEESALDSAVPMDSTSIRHRCRVHVHRCHKVAVTVTFNGIQKVESFPPAATMKRVKQWAVGKRGFDMSDIDAAEHVLQLTNKERPDEDVHVGALVLAPHCSVPFDLVPKVRVEG